jgi:hypothetical protein
MTEQHVNQCFENYLCFFFFLAWPMHPQIMMKIRPTKCIFKLNHIFRISILLLQLSALQECHLQGAQKDPDEIERMLRHKCQISEGREEWLLSVCCQLVPATENTQIVSPPYLHLFGTMM